MDPRRRNGGFNKGEIMADEIGVPQAIRDAVVKVGNDNGQPWLFIFDYKDNRLTLDGTDDIDDLIVEQIENTLEDRDDVSVVDWYTED